MMPPAYPSELEDRIVLSVLRKPLRHVGVVVSSRVRHGVAEIVVVPRV